jgi:acyl-CoA synthetase (AMP-forming)/AMP-acid ligase II
VAPMIQAVLDHPRLNDFDRTSVRTIMSASAPIPAPLLVRAIEQFGPVFFVCYGSTETANVAILEKHEVKPHGSERDVQRLLSIGHFNPEVPAVVLDDEGRECPAGVVGEICVDSPVFVGYWNNDAATIEATRDGWFHTGDLAYQDDEGFVFIVDRKKDMILSGGENIYSREVEEALFGHPAVAAAAVVGVADSKWGEVVKAIVVLRQGAAVGEAALIEHCQRQIARYKCPRSIDFVEELPVLGTGKVDKVTLRQRYRG